MSKFKSVCQAAGVPMSSVGSIHGIRPTSLSSIMRDLMRLTSEQETELMTTAFRLSDLRDALHPLRLPDEPMILKTLLDGLESERISLEFIRQFVSMLLNDE